MKVWAVSLPDGRVPLTDVSSAFGSFYSPDSQQSVETDPPGTEICIRPGRLLCAHNYFRFVTPRPPDDHVIGLPIISIIGGALSLLTTVRRTRMDTVLLISRSLSYSVILLSFCMKLPQILAIFSAKGSRGLNLRGYWMEIAW